MSRKLIKTIDGKEFYAKYADYAAADENGDKISDRKVKSVTVSGRTMTVTNTDGEIEVPVVPIPEEEGLFLKAGASGEYSWGHTEVPGDGMLRLKLGSATAADTGFSANAQSAVTVEIPVATTTVDGLMSAEDKTALETAELAISELDANKASKDELETEVTALEGSISGLSTDVSNLDSAKANKSEMSITDGLGVTTIQLQPNMTTTVLTQHQDISGKADVATTLAGYGITDAYTKTEVDNSLAGKVDQDGDKVLSTNDYTDADKGKLEGIAAGAQVNVIESITAGGTELPISDKTVNISVMTGATAQASGATGLVPQPLSADVDKFLRGDATWAELPVATTTDAGLMSSTDKAKLDGIATGAQVNAIETINLGNTELAPIGKTVTVPMFDGSNSGAVTAPTAGNANSASFLNGMGDWSMLEEVTDADIDDIFVGKPVIAGRKYKVVQIGDQIWTAENLDYQIPDVAFNPTSDTGEGAMQMYYAMSSDYSLDGTYKLGMMYNGSAVNSYLIPSIPTLAPGWHVATKTDWNTLVTYIGGSANVSKIKALDGSITQDFPSGWNGTADYGFNLLPGGEASRQYSSRPAYGGLGTLVRFRLGSGSGYNTDGIYIDQSSYLANTNLSYSYCGYVRLVKDAN